MVCRRKIIGFLFSVSFFDSIQEIHFSILSWSLGSLELTVGLLSFITFVCLRGCVYFYSNVPKIILALGLVQACKINMWEMFGVITDVHFKTSFTNVFY